jgi:hypothetical protein
MCGGNRDGIRDEGDLGRWLVEVRVEGLSVRGMLGRSMGEECLVGRHRGILGGERKMGRILRVGGLRSWVLRHLFEGLPVLEMPLRCGRGCRVLIRVLWLCKRPIE